jgi:O-methyltransferase
MSEPSERDVHLRKRGAAAATILEHESRDSRTWAIASLDDVRDGFSSVDDPRELVHFVEGKVEDTIPDRAPEEIAILRLDTDWYESTRHELTHLYQRLAPGGVLIIDDYGTWKGSKDATDEFVAETGEPLLLVRTGRGRAAVKPGLTSRVV